MRIGGIDTINLETTWNCNLKCYMCARTTYYENKLPSKEMPIDLLFKVFETFPELKHLSLAGHGEPLLYTHFSTS